MRLSFGTTNLSPPRSISGEDGAGVIVVAVVFRTLGGMCAACPPSAVLTVTSGDVATMISSVDELCAELSRVTVGVRDGCSRPVVDEDSGMQFAFRISHIRLTLR